MAAILFSIPTVLTSPSFYFRHPQQTTCMEWGKLIAIDVEMKSLNLCNFPEDLINS